MGERNKTRLAQLRRARGLTQSEIAYDLGVSKATYSSWESGRIELGAARLVALAERLCCTPNDILGYSHEPSAARGDPAACERLSSECRECAPLAQAPRERTSLVLAFRERTSLM